MTQYAGEVRIKTKLDAKGINEGMKKVSASLADAGIVAVRAAMAALVGITAIAGGIAMLMKNMMKMEGFKGKFNELNLALKNLQNAAYSALMPLVNALLPTLMRIVDWLTRAANAAAAFFALLTGASSYSIYVSSEYADNMERAEKAAKGSVASFDKLNVLNKQEEPGGSDGPGGEWVEKEIDFSWADELKDKLFLIKTIAEAIGVAILAWGISKLLGFDLTTTIGLMLSVSGAVMLVKGAVDALKNGVDWDNLILMVGGLALVFAGLWIAFGLTVAAIGLLVGGIALLVIGIMDWIKNGELSAQTFWLLEAAIIAVGVALALLLGWPALAVAAVIGIALAIYKYWDEIKGFFIDLWEKIKEVWGKVATWFDENVIQPVVEFFRELWEKVSGFFNVLWEDIKGIWETVSNWFSKHVTEPVQELFNIFSEKVKGFLESPFESLGEFVKGIFNGIIGFLNGLLNGLVEGINWIIEKLNTISFAIPDWVPVIGGKEFGINLPLASGLQIPYLATGAVIPPNAPFAAILGDQRSGTNVEAPLSTIERAVENVLARRGAFNTEDRMIHNEIKIEGQVLYDAYKRIEKRIGKSLLSGSMAQ